MIEIGKSKIRHSYLCKYSTNRIMLMHFSMPYTEAFIAELLRIASVGPFGLPRLVSEDFKFHGYFIRKGTSIIPSIYSTHYDPNVFSEPNKFQPERFLSSDAKTVLKNDSLIPFLIGRRACLGETFARSQLFLFVTSLVQNFNIVAEPGKPKPLLATKHGQGTLGPQHYYVVMNCRE